MSRAFYSFHPGWVNQAWMELGSLQCTPKNPNCQTCPLNDSCTAFIQRKVLEFPKKTKKQKLPTRYGAAFIIENNNKQLLLRRPTEGFLGGLWEYPSFTLKEPNADYLGKFCDNHKIKILQELPYKAKHSYSHFHQELTLYKAKKCEDSQFPEWQESCEVNESDMQKLARSKLTIKISELNK